MKRLIPIAAIAALTLPATAWAGDLVPAAELPAVIDQSGFDLGIRLPVGPAVTTTIVPEVEGLARYDVILCNSSENDGGYRLDSRWKPGGPTGNYKVAAKSCVALYGVPSLLADTGSGEGWSGVALLRPHAN